MNVADAMLKQTKSPLSVAEAPKVSIILTCYNLERYIAAAIESALSQDYINLEIICVDDGSSDQSRQIIENFQNKIAIVLKENGGHASAVSAGFEVSTGDIVIFFDGDDLLYPTCVSTVVKNWLPGLALCQYANDYVDATGAIINRQKINLTDPNFVNGNIRDIVLRSGGFSHQTQSGCAFARNFLEKVLPFPNTETWRVHADMYFCFLAALYGDICSVQTVLFGYRIHGNNASAIDKKKPLPLKSYIRRYECGRGLHDAMVNFAGSLGLVASLPDPMGEPSLLKGMLIIRKFDGSYRFPSDENGRHRTTLYFWRRIILQALKSKQISIAKKLAYCLWASSVCFLPRKPAERFIIATEPQNRTIFRSR